jgi:hypothetical protein
MTAHFSSESLDAKKEMTRYFSSPERKDLLTQNLIASGMKEKSRHSQVENCVITTLTLQEQLQGIL